MTQVTSKTSWRLPKVHLRTYNRSLGGLVVKWECAERVKVTQNNSKKFLHHFLEAITLFRVVWFSIFLLILKIGDHIYQNQLRNWKLDHSERRESQSKKGAPRIRGPRVLKNWNRLFSKGFHSNLVQLAFLSLEIDIRPIFGVSGDFSWLRKKSVFSDLAWFQWKIGMVLGAVISLPNVNQWLK